MTDITALSALAIKAQSAPGTYASPTTSDLIGCANLSWRPNAITAENPEYLGTIHRPGQIVLGATYDVTYDLMLRGPGGASPPAADAFIFGRVLRSLGFTENILSAAIPVAAEAGSAGTTTGLTLGAGAAATADLYNGLAIHLAANGAMPTSLTMIRDYTAAKVATFAEIFGGALSGNYQIPKQIAYTLAASGTPPVLSKSLWQGGRRYNFVDMSPSSATLTLPTSSRDGGSDFSRLSVTFSGDLNSYIDEAAPAIVPGIAIPPFKGGKLHIAGLSMGGSSLSIDLGPRVGFPPNPNKASGSDPSQLVETRRTLSMTLNQVAKSYSDLIALAQAQSVNPIQALYGLATGNYMGFVATDARFNFPESQAGGDFFQTVGEAYVDGADKTISLTFPYYP